LILARIVAVAQKVAMVDQHRAISAMLLETFQTTYDEPSTLACGFAVYVIAKWLVVVFAAASASERSTSVITIPKWMPRLSRRVLNQRRGKPKGGSAEPEDRTDESIIRHAGLGPSDMVELVRASSLAPC
jgi:hypothetical protein